MKKYTIIYSVYVGYVGSRVYKTEYDRIETDNLEELLATEKYNGFTHFVFDGWPEMAQSEIPNCW